jgi:ELWxxDGT repeat protein
MIADIEPGPISSLPQNMNAIGRALFFAADDGSGLEPWRSDGTASGTFRLADIEPGPAASVPAGFTRVGDYVFFAASSSRSGRELWTLPARVLWRPRRPALH